jgi:cysteinyl-tRNA synthetase
MHVGFIQINKEKMSKSLNNFFTIRDILKEYDAEVVRYFLLASHYRSPVNFSKEQLEQAKNALERLYTALRGISLPTERVVTPAAFYIQRFTDAMNDDFNTPIALSVIFECAHALNSAREKGEVDKQFELAATLKYCGNILGVLERSPDEFLQGDEQDISKIKNLIADRENARSSKEWARADEIRQMLTAMGIALEDKPEGTIWRKI